MAGYTEDWFLESEPNGCCFDAFLYPWLIKQNSEDGWQAFDDANEQGTWWWNKHTEDWFLESEPGDWMVFADPVSDQTYWCHLDGRYFCASLEPWLIEEQCDVD